MLLNDLKESITNCYYQESNNEFMNNRDKIDEALLILEKIEDILVEKQELKVEIGKTYKSKFLEYKVKVINYLDNKVPEVVYDMQDNSYNFPTDILYQESVNTFKDRFVEI